MYKDEIKDRFDGWHQEDTRQLNREIALAMLKGWNFNSILDIGCGKGVLTHVLKKHNNRILGIDISETAIENARARYPDIDFDVADITMSYGLIDCLNKAKGHCDEFVDLVFTSETLSYLENWEDILCAISGHTRYLLISLFVPDNPIGFVKSPEILSRAVSENFEIIETVTLEKSKFIVIFAKQKANIED
jgi:2-polyprenyl-3-methyl-5-hydroxy-6-metoxy-1,4-benzoquinol methylase